jgi:hypothetical protein
MSQLSCWTKCCRSQPDGVPVCLEQGICCCIRVLPYPSRPSSMSACLQKCPAESKWPFQSILMDRLRPATVRIWWSSKTTQASLAIVCLNDYSVLHMPWALRAVLFCTLSIIANTSWII